MEKYQPEILIFVEIYLGPGKRRGELDNRKNEIAIGRLSKECLVSVGHSIGEYCEKKYKSDIRYGTFFDKNQAFEFSEKISGLDGICSKIITIKSEEYK